MPPVTKLSIARINHLRKVCGSWPLDITVCPLARPAFLALTRRLRVSFLYANGSPASKPCEQQRKRCQDDHAH